MNTIVTGRGRVLSVSKKKELRRSARPWKGQRKRQGAMLNIQGIGFCFLHSDRERFNSEINVDRNANMSEWGLKMRVVPLTLNHRVQGDLAAPPVATVFHHGPPTYWPYRRSKEN